MKNTILIILMAALILVSHCGFGNAFEPAPITGDVKFIPVDIIIDSGEKAVAAYQFELSVRAGDARLSGVEGGDCEAFKEPGYYDPKALSHGRIILAAFNLDTASPTGKFRCARLHFMVTGDQLPEFDITPVLVADSKGKKLNSEITYELIENK